MEVSCQLKWNPKVHKGLKTIPDDILYEVALETLDRSYNLIPMSNIKNHSGTLRRSSKSGGVRGGNGDYWIGSYTKYASYVWNMEGVNWTTPGTNNKWYARTLKRYGQTIIQNSISKSWRKDMR